jgi:hypothetical protein
MSDDPVQATRKGPDLGRIWPKNPKGVGVDDLLRTRGSDPAFHPDGSLRMIAHMVLPFESYSETCAFGDRLGNVFDAIPQEALAADPAESDTEAFARALKFCLALITLASMGGRTRLGHVLTSLHKGVVAVDDRLRGIDEPLLGAIRSPSAARDDHYARCVKTWCAMAGWSLVSMGVPKKKRPQRWRML